MEIRLATIDDLEQAIVKGREFGAIGHPHVPYCDESMRKLLTRMIQDGTLIVAIEQGRIVGGIGGIACPFAQNMREWMLIENFWWVEPESRGSTGVRLLMAFEKRAPEINCRHVYMIALEHMNVARVDGIYQRLGYVLAERGYYKKVA